MSTSASAGCEEMEGGVGLGAEQMVVLVQFFF